MAVTSATAKNADVQITLIGMKEFDKQLKRLSSAASKEARVKALTAGARIVQHDASLNAPVGQIDRKIGHLYEHIIIKTTVNKAQETEVAVGPDAKHWYGTFVEFGTSKAAAQPFLRPALDENVDLIQEAIRKELRAQIKRLTRA